MTRVNPATPFLLALALLPVPAFAGGTDPDLSKVDGEELPVGDSIGATGCLELITGEVFPVTGVASRVLHLEPVQGLPIKPRSLRADLRNVAAVSARRGGYVDVRLRDGRAIWGMALRDVVLDVPSTRSIEWDQVRALDLDWSVPPPTDAPLEGTVLRIESSAAPELVLGNVETVDTWVEMYGVHSYRVVQRIGGDLPFARITPATCAVDEWAIPLAKIVRIDVDGRWSTLTADGPDGPLVLEGGVAGQRVRRTDADSGLRGSDRLGTWTFSPFSSAVPKPKPGAPEPHLRMTIERAESARAASPLRPDARCVGWNGDTFDCRVREIRPIEVLANGKVTKVAPADVRKISFSGDDPAAKRETSCVDGVWQPATITTKDGRVLEGKAATGFGSVETRTSGFARYVSGNVLREVELLTK